MLRLFIFREAISAIVLLLAISTISNFSNFLILNISLFPDIDNSGIFNSAKEFLTDKFSIFNVWEDNTKFLKSYVILLNYPLFNFR